MVETPNPVGRFGGVKRLEDRLRGRSRVIAENKEGVAQTLVDLASAKLTDVLSWDADGNVSIKASSEIDESTAAAIKRIRVTRGRDAEPNLELEMHDKVSVLRILAKSAGLLEAVAAENAAPSVVGIKMVGPEVKTTYEEVDDGNSESGS